MVCCEGGEATNPGSCSQMEAAGAAPRAVVAITVVPAVASASGEETAAAEAWVAVQNKTAGEAGGKAGEATDPSCKAWPSLPIDRLSARLPVSKAHLPIGNL